MSDRKTLDERQQMSDIDRLRHSCAHVMATAILAMIPPAVVVMLMQKWFVKGLVDTEK